SNSRWLVDKDSARKLEIPLWPLLEARSAGVLTSGISGYGYVTAIVDAPMDTKTSTGSLPNTTILTPDLNNFSPSSYGLLLCGYLSSFLSSSLAKNSPSSENFLPFLMVCRLSFLASIPFFS
ncbi:hypothetical protein V8G54_000540, partial [Vigna mungo]